MLLIERTRVIGKKHQFSSYSDKRDNNGVLDTILISCYTMDWDDNDV